MVVVLDVLEHDDQVLGHPLDRVHQVRKVSAAGDNLVLDPDADQEVGDVSEARGPGGGGNDKNPRLG